MDARLIPTLSAATPVQPLTITLFGSFQVALQQQPVVHFRSNKARALLAYLMLAHSKPVKRATLTDLLWQGYAPASARASLRQALANLRDLLAPFARIEGDYQTVQLTFDAAGVWCDALVFDELFDACQRHDHAALTQCPLCQIKLQQAVAWYTGPLLAGLGAVDSQPFTEWLATQRAHYATRFAQAQAALRPATQVPGNLPQPLTPLIGRTAELSELTAKLLHPVYRCLTLIGPGGIGKTRLAIALGAQLCASFVDGVWFVALAALDPATGENNHLHDQLATAIGAALGLTWQGAAHPAEQLIAYLRPKALLLILDNFEHLIAEAELLATLLQEAPQVRLLVTSRHRLSLQAQLVYQVAGLALPPEKLTETLLTVEAIDRYASLQLFVERATNALFPVTYDAPTLTTISTLCRLLEGAPLGIELAVALLETQTPTEILRAVRGHYTALQANLGDLPTRQRSAYAVLHTAWGLLSAQEAQTLARCSVFRGGFTLAAAQKIIDAQPADLETLVNKSLLYHSGGDVGAALGIGPESGRYTLHELVRQFAAEQLAAQTAIAQLIQHRHSAYYLALLESWQPGAVAERTFRQTVQVELANVEHAWEWALNSGLVTHLLGAVPGLAEFYELANAHHASEAILQRSLLQVRSRLAATPATGDHDDCLRQLLAALLGRLAYLYAQSLGQAQQALPLAAEGLALAETLANPALITYSYFVSQLAAFSAYDFVRGRTLAETGLALAQRYGLRREEALALVGIGLHGTMLSDYTTAINGLIQAITLAQQINDPRLEQMIRTSLGVAYRMMGDLAQAAHCFTENLPLLRQNDNQYQIAGTLVNLGILQLSLGNYVAASGYIEEAYQMFTTLGEKRLTAECLFALGWSCVQSGDNARAVAYCQQALAQAASAPTQQMAWLTLGEAHLNAGDFAAAQAAFTQVLAISGGGPAERWHGQAGLAAVWLAQNDNAAALAVVDRLLPEFDPAQPDGWGCPQRLLLTCYRVLAANQDLRAAALLRQAWQVVQDQAEKISDPDLRTTFLNNVPVNRVLGLLVATTTS